MTLKTVQELIRTQSEGALTTLNGHTLTLGQVLVPPERISVVMRLGRAHKPHEEVIDAWLVGKEPGDGYYIVMRDDDVVCGLASKGFPSDRYLVLVGWYGDLISAFENM